MQVLGAAGVPIGHASIAITLDRYGHLFDTDAGHAAAAFAAYLDRADTTGRLRQLEKAGDGEMGD